MKRLLMWFVLLNKRLYKKITYVGFLILIPLLVILFSAAAKESSGLVTVVLAREDPQDALAAAITEQLKEDTLVIAFREETPQAALELVSAGKADAAWIFPADLQSCLKAYINGDSGSEGFVHVVEREQTVPLRLAREKLSAAVHTRSVEVTFLQYIRQIAPETEAVSDRELLTYLDNTRVSGELFEFYDIYGNRREETANYLTTPIRGILAVLAVISAIVTAMFYQSDLDRGIFSLLPEKHRSLGEFGYQMISSANILAFVLIALGFAGLTVSLWTELLLFVLYSLCCALFGMVLRGLFGGRRGLAVLIPVMTVVMLAVCPVFFDLAVVRRLQFLLPPTYYVNCAYNYKYFGYLVLYILALFVILLAVSWLKQALRRRKK